MQLSLIVIVTKKNVSGLILDEKQSTDNNLKPTSCVNEPVQDSNHTRTLKHAIPSNNRLTKEKVKYTGDKVIKSAIKSLSILQMYLNNF